MYIGMLSDVYFPRVNGVSTSIRTFRRDLEAMGHQVVLVAPEYPGQPATADPVLRVPSRHLFFDPEDRLMRGRDLRSACQDLALHDLDVIHVHTPFQAHYAGLRLSSRTNLPLVETYHTYFEEYLFHYAPVLPRPLLRGLARAVSRSQCRRVDCLVVPSRAMLDILRGYGIKTPAEIIPTGIASDSLTEVRGQRFRERLPIEADTPLVLCIGRVAFEKNLDFLLRVFKRVRGKVDRAVLVVAGEGPALNHLKRLAGRLGLGSSIRFVGYLSREDALLDCYRAADVTVFASRTETQGLVPLESMAQGTPVVSTAVMGTRDIIEPQRGCLKAPEDEEEFAAKVVTLLQNDELRRELGREAAAFAREWSSRAMAMKLLALYQRLTAP